MKIKYLGGRSRYEISYDRKSYHFIPENNKTLDIQDTKVINYIFSLPNRTEFEAVLWDDKPVAPKEEPQKLSKGNIGPTKKKIGRPKKGKK